MLTQLLRDVVLQVCGHEELETLIVYGLLTRMDGEIEKKKSQIPWI